MKRFFWKYSGIEFVVSAIESGVLRYRLRVRMVPVSYKVFLWSLGMVTGTAGMFVYMVGGSLYEGESVVFENVQAESVPVVMEVVEEEGRDLVDEIFTLESSRGKNNFSKCEAIGKFNRYGFGIPGDGSFLCFEDGQDTVAVAGWIAQKKALGLSDDTILCLYNTGKAVDSCAYSEKAKSIR